MMNSLNPFSEYIGHFIYQCFARAISMHIHRFFPSVKVLLITELKVNDVLCFGQSHYEARHEWNFSCQDSKNGVWTRKISSFSSFSFCWRFVLLFLEKNLRRFCCFKTREWSTSSENERNRKFSFLNDLFFFSIRLFRSRKPNWNKLKKRFKRKKKHFSTIFVKWAKWSKFSFVFFISVAFFFSREMEHYQVFNKRMNNFVTKFNVYKRITIQQRMKFVRWKICLKDEFNLWINILRPLFLWVSTNIFNCFPLWLIVYCCFCSSESSESIDFIWSLIVFPTIEFARWFSFILH